MGDRIEIYGASDDLIEIEGAIREEFPASRESDLIAVSDGTLLRITYTKDGIWRIDTLRAGLAVLTIIPNAGADSDNYTDRAVLEAETIGWVVRGSDWATR